MNVCSAVLVVRAGGGCHWVVTEATEKNGEIQEILKLTWQDFEGPGMADKEEKEGDVRTSPGLLDRKLTMWWCLSLPRAIR